MSENKIYRILIADDEAELVDAMSLYLEKAGFDTIKAEDGQAALEAFDKYHPDLILLDVMMPKADGFSVLREIRKKSHIPAIMLTVRNDSDDMVLGLDTGADDYITKPYDPREVVARVKAQLRRSYSYTDLSEDSAGIIVSGDLQLDPNKKSVTKAGEQIWLSAIEYRILELLMSSPGKIFTKRQIYESAWSGDFMADDNTIMVRISNIRHKIQDDPKDPKIITVKGLGYKFEG
ncbi:MAG: response regulator transcription factor [Lachnospiraceae bacterium]|nr:response regulator transcription factor [Lachnospiraceae bacterium]